MRIAQDIGRRPPRTNAVHDGIDLRRGQQTAGALRKRRHGGSRNTVGGDTADRRIVGDGEVHRIGQRERGSPDAVRAVASGAVRGVEDGEVDDFVGRDHL